MQSTRNVTYLPINIGHMRHKATVTFNTVNVLILMLLPVYFINITVVQVNG